MEKTIFDQKPDIEVLFEFIGTRKNPIVTHVEKFKFLRYNGTQNPNNHVNRRREKKASLFNIFIPPVCYKIKY